MKKTIFISLQREQNRRKIKLVSEKKTLQAKIEVLEHQTTKNFQQIVIFFF